MTFQNLITRNNITGLLDAGISTEGDTLIIKEEYQDLFPEPTPTRPYLLTIERLDEEFRVTKREIVKVIEKTANVLTIERSAGYCPSSYNATTYTNTAFSFLAGDKVSLYITSENDEDIKEELVRLDNTDKDIYANGDNRLKVRKTTGLGIQIGAGNYRIGNAEGMYAGGTATLDDDSDSYIMITGSGVINISTIGRDVNHLRLAKATTLDGEITDLEMRKPDAVGGILGGGGFNNITDCVYNVNAQLESFIGDGVTFTLTYTLNGSVSTISNGSNTWTVSYNSSGNFNGLSKV